MVVNYMVCDERNACSCLNGFSFLPFFIDLARTGLFRTASGFHGTTDVDVVVVVAAGQVVEATVGFRERREVEREPCGAAHM